MPGLLALAIAMGIGRFAFTPILPMMQEDAGLSLAAGGWLASANYVGYLVGALMALVARGSPQAMIRLGLVLVAGTTAAMAVTDSLTAWMILRFAAGVASAWVLVYVSALGVARPEVVFSGVGVGIAVAGLVCLALVGMHMASDVAWISLGVLAMAATVSIWPRFAAHAGGDATHDGKPFPWTGEAVRLTAAYFAFGFGYIVPATFLPAMARDFLTDPVHYGLSWPVFGVAAAASTLLSAPLRRRLGDRALWRAGHIAMACGTGVLALEAVPALWRTLVCALLVGGSFVVVTMSAIQDARRLAIPGSAPKFIAALTTAFAAGQIAGPIVVAMTHDYQVSLTLATVLLVAAAFLLQRSNSSRG